MEEKIIEIIKNELKVDLIYLFGSVLTNRFNSESDIDIAIFSSKSIDKKSLAKTKLELINQLNSEIDLVDLKDCSIVLKKEIIYKGKSIYASSKELKENFEYTSVVIYGQYQDDIKDIIKKRGKILCKK